MNDFKTQNNKPWEKPWPSDGLEQLNHCPVCGFINREIIHNDLIDNVFFCAFGKWTLWRCGKCSSAYLDPRPTQESIGLAYGNYYTHLLATTSGNYLKRLVVSLRNRLRNSYINTKFGHAIKPDLGQANILTKLLPESITLRWDYYIRHIPASTSGKHYLDIGCGNGSFLRIASDLKYDTTGLEVDPTAVHAAQAMGCDVVEGALPVTGFDAAKFDQITLNHVLEHLHDPVGSIREVYRLLKRGGRLWLQLPNIDALGHDIYGPLWRGLEPPRHLILPSLHALKKILVKEGFTQIELLKPMDVVDGYFDRSEIIYQYVCGNKNVIPLVSRRERRIAKSYEKKHPDRHEELTMVAFKL